MFQRSPHSVHVTLLPSPINVRIALTVKYNIISPKQDINKENASENSLTNF